MTAQLARYAAAAVLLNGGCMAQTPQPPLSTVVLGQSDSRTSHGDWGRIWIYAEGQTAGTQDMFAARVALQPGAQIHPAHQHAEEEYLLVISGRGSWTLAGKTFAAKAGDLLYAAPGDLHGIVAAPDSQLTFFVWKWRSQAAGPAAVEARKP